MKSHQCNSQGLETDLKALKSEVKTLKSNNKLVKSECEIVKRDNSRLLEKCTEHHKALIKFMNSKEKFTNMLESQQYYRDRKGIGYSPKHDKIIERNTTFVKSSNQIWRKSKCHFCGRIGHKYGTCPFRRNDPHIIKNSFPILLRSQVKQIWVPKGTRPPNMVFPEYGNKFVAWVSRKG